MVAMTLTSSNIIPASAPRMLAVLLTGVLLQKVSNKLGSRKLKDRRKTLPRQTRTTMPYRVAVLESDLEIGVVASSVYDKPPALLRFKIADGFQLERFWGRLSPASFWRERRDWNSKAGITTEGQTDDT